MKKLIKSKLFIIAVGVVLILMITFFPHVKTTKVDGELVGQNITVKETYLLHRKTSIKTTNVCLVGVAIRVTEVNYYLDGSVKSIYEESCEFDTYLITYSKEGNLVEEYSLTIFPTGLSEMKVEYNQYGQEISEIVYSAPNETITTTSYDGYYKSEKLEESYKYGVLVEKTVYQYDELGLLEETYLETFNLSGGPLLIEFSNDIEEESEDFKATCDTEGLCTLDYYTTDEFSFIKNTNNENYTLILGDTVTYNENLGGFFPDEIDNIIDTIKLKTEE